MKALFGFLLFVTLGIVANGQSAPKIIAEVASGSERVVKGAPFSAEAVSESVQTLADGNRIVRSSTSKLYRSGDGRFRRESSGASGGMLGSFYELQNGISILDPVVGYRYYLNPGSKTVKSIVLNSISDTFASGKIQAALAEKSEALKKVQTELDAAQVSGKLQAELNRAQASGKLSPETEQNVRVAVEHAVEAVRAIPAIPPLPPVPFSFVFENGFAKDSANTRTESLGIQNIEGVDAEGTRTTTTIEAGKIGNERPIEIVYERWYSKDLQLVVMSKHSDPRHGEQTYRLTNINRSEPNPSLFSLPADYKIQSGAANVFKLRAPKGEGQNFYTIKAPEAVKGAKP